jgi:hypothetical protein
MKKLTLLFGLFLCINLSAQKSDKWYSLRDYEPFTTARTIRYPISLAQGIFNGLGQSFDKDHHIFENRWNAGEVSFWGSRQDLLQYDESGNHKNELWNSLRDLQHMDAFGDKFVNGGLYLSIGVAKICEMRRDYRHGLKPKHIWRDIILDCAINSALQTIGTSVTYSITTRTRLFVF